MVLGWFKKRRRRQLLREPFPREWWEHLRHNLPLYRSLPPPLQIRLRDLVRIFVAEKEWVGCNGL
ncbi:MAG: zinc-dependent peptidase, partial [Thermoguttaceae bacterium]|nr:zinc-dependent peptidase [Thermoguttaceae bacterium]